MALLALLALRGAAPADGSWGFDTRWLYYLQVAGPAAMLAYWWREFGEMLLSVVVGQAVFGAWIHLDAPWMTMRAGAVSAVVATDAAGAIDWPLVAVRIAGAALLVPVMEELFWRSFLMRWIQAPVFEGVAPQRVGLKAIVLSTFLFVLAHPLWLAAIVAGLAYAWLYIRTGRLWAPVVAHAVTNGVLGGWVVATGNWQFW